ncbi:MAG: RNA recognition motif domain-containing protein [Pyrinomonadaceae bacterium]
MSIKLYVGNLSFQTSSDDLQQLFAQVGTVESATVVEDRDTGRSRGFAFVEMASKEEGDKAIEQFNGTDFNGRNLTVNEPDLEKIAAGAAEGAGALAAIAGVAAAEISVAATTARRAGNEKGMMIPNRMQIAP